MKRIIIVSLFILSLGLGILFDIAPICVGDGLDKCYHFFGFGFLTLLSILCFLDFYGKSKINYFMVMLLLFGWFFAAISELIQKYVAVRSCDVYDWFVNLLGITFVCVIAFLVFCKQKKDFEIGQDNLDLRDLYILS